MARTNQNFGNRKQELTRYALELFLENTYEKTTTRDVMNRAGISQGALYHYFQSKEDMLEAVIEYITDQAYEIFAWVEDDRMNAGDKFLRIFEESANHMQIQEIQQINQHITENQHSLFFYRAMLQTQQIRRDLIRKIIIQGNHEDIFDSGSPEIHCAVIQSAFESIEGFAGEESLEDYVQEVIRIIRYCLNFNDDYQKQLLTTLLGLLQKTRRSIYENL